MTRTVLNQQMTTFPLVQALIRQIFIRVLLLFRRSNRHLFLFQISKPIYLFIDFLPPHLCVMQTTVESLWLIQFGRQVEVFFDLYVLQQRLLGRKSILLVFSGRYADGCRVLVRSRHFRHILMVRYKHFLTLDL